ncbi:hypothetical protein CZ774_14090 [Frigoribacterium sp. JB110]|nr:hypothetical protein CZ774_14090 [Frigoribacterium sp. JB110]
MHTSMPHVRTFRLRLGPLHGRVGSAENEFPSDLACSSNTQ